MRQILLLLLPLLCIFVTKAAAVDCTWYSKSGSALSAAITIAGIGANFNRLDYVGANRWIIGDNTNVYEIEVGVSAGFLIRTIHALGSNSNTRGLWFIRDCPHGELDEQDCVKGDAYVLIKRTCRGSPICTVDFTMDIRDFITGSLLTTDAGKLSQFDNPHGIAGDGESLFVYSDLTSFPTVYSVRKFIFNPGFVQIRNFDHGVVGINDAYFDGESMWILFDTTVAKYKDYTLQELEFSFAHALATPTGLSSDGEKLLICT